MRKYTVMKRNCKTNVREEEKATVIVPTEQSDLEKALER